MKTVRIDLANGSFVDVPLDVQELDQLTIVKQNGKKQKARWGSIIAHTNGEALRAFLLNQ